MRSPRALITFQVVAAIGICVWWVYWFVSGSNLHGSSCALAYENSFPLADLVLAGALGATAWALHRRHPTMVVLGGLAAGMAFSLAALDTTHNLLTGGFAGPIGVTVRKAVFAVVNGSVGVWTLVWLHRWASESPRPPAWMGVPATLSAVVAVLGVLVVGAWPDGCSGALSGSAVGWAVLVGLVAVYARAAPSAVLVGALCHGALVLALGVL